MLKEKIEFFTHNNKTQAITTVYHKYDTLAVLVIVFPEVSIAAMSRHVKCSESNILICKQINYLA
jgi:hypothetical protein